MPSPPIYSVRGHQVMLATDLASLFDVSPKRMNESIRRNEVRFPGDFGFRLTRQELENLRPQFAASSSGHGGHRHPPFAVTEYGVVMLANVVDSDRAIAMSVQVVREFIQLRTITRSQSSLRKKLGQLARAVQSHELQIDELFAAIEPLIDNSVDPEPPKQIGFVP